VKDMTSKPRKRTKANTSCDEPKHHIVLSGKRTIVGVEDKTDMSQDYNQFGEIPPFRVNTDTSLKLNDEDALCNVLFQYLGAPWHHNESYLMNC
jgi:hypothetical protein